MLPTPFSAPNGEKWGYTVNLKEITKALTQCPKGTDLVTPLRVFRKKYNGFSDSPSWVRVETNSINYLETSQSIAKYLKDTETRGPWALL